MNMNRNKNTILCIDDDRDDLELLEAAFQSLDNTYHIQKAADGLEGLQQLQRLKLSGSLPCLIVLDLNMPRLNGRETFERIKADPAFATIPVVIFTTSSYPKEQSYFISKNIAFITKPTDYRLFLEMAKRLLAYCETEMVNKSSFSC